MRAGPARAFVRIDPGETYSARVRITLATDRNEKGRFIWFLNEFGAARNLADRVSSIGITDTSGRKIAERKIGAGEQLQISGIAGIEYRIRLKQADSAFTAAHTSWAGPAGGLLMLDDLLPQGIGREAIVRLELPAGWRAFALETDAAGSEIRTLNVEKTAISIGPGRREVRAATTIGEAKVNIAGEWRFADDDAAKMAASIANEYARLLGNEVGPGFNVSISRFPFDSQVGNWEGDTRGRSITIFSSDMPFRNQSLQRLHEQLRHEIFHLWIPNAVNLAGRYDWFYEGFALYQSLRTGVALNQLRFEDYLDTLARAYDIDAAAGPRVSLVGASRDRWNGHGTQVYARGMLVAFLCDLILLDRSKGKLSASTLIREVFAAGRTPVPADGNAVVVEVIRKRPELRAVVDNYIAGSQRIEWDPVLRAAGIVAGRSGTVTRLTVDPKASGAAKKTLERLGVANWRHGTGQK